MRPLSLLCELTYRCNLQCPYCYNPLALQAYRDELATAQWIAVLEDAAGLGVVQAHFSGGEPTLRRDLDALVGAASRSGLYTNLITQGTFLDDALLDELIANGLDHVQISIQAPEAKLAERIAGTDVHEKKLDALRRVSRRPVALTLNCVLHRLEPRYDRGGYCVRRRAADRAPGACERAVLRVGLPQSRGADADAGPGSTGRRRSWQPPASACAERWRLSTFSPIISANFPNRA